MSLYHVASPFLDSIRNRHLIPVFTRRAHTMGQDLYEAIPIPTCGFDPFAGYAQTDDRTTRQLKHHG